MFFIFEILKNLFETIVITKFKFMKSFVITTTNEIIETTKTIIVDLKTKTKKNKLNFDLFEIVKIIINLNYR